MTMRLQEMMFEPPVPALFGGFPFSQFLSYNPRDIDGHNMGRMNRQQRRDGTRQTDQSVHDIPDDFWEPVTEEEISQMRNQHAQDRFNIEPGSSYNQRYKSSGNGGEYRDGRTRIIPIEFEGEEYINISDDEDCVILPERRKFENSNNNGKCQKSRIVNSDYSDLPTIRKRSTPIASTSRKQSRSSSPECFEIDTSKGKKLGKSVTPILKSQHSTRSRPLFDSKEEEVQFNELVQFFSDNQCDQSDTTSESVSDFETPPSYPAYDVIRKIISAEGRVVDYVKGDGNCFFRALSKIIYGSESSHEQLRQAVVDFVEKYPQRFEQFVDQGHLQDHLICMRENGTWGTQLEIYAAATLLQRDIYVLSPDHSGKNYRWLLFTPRFSYPEANAYDRCYITLCHTNGNHYDRIASKTGSCNCARPEPVLGGIQTEVDLTEQIPEVV